MTISELIERLEVMQEEYGDLPVRTATQPGYPMQGYLLGVAVGSAAGVPVSEFEAEGDTPEALFLVEGGGSSDHPYASRELWDAARDW